MIRVFDGRCRCTVHEFMQRAAGEVHRNLDGTRCIKARDHVTFGTRRLFRVSRDDRRRNRFTGFRRDPERQLLPAMFSRRIVRQRLRQFLVVQVEQ